MIWGVNDRDTETTWVNECSAIAALGTTPGPQCAGY